jgi:hypothetical protein
MSLLKRICLVLPLRCLSTCAASAAVFGLNVAYAQQDLYAPNILRTIDISFAQPDWEQLLRNNYNSETDIEGTVIVEGVTYPRVGIRIRGNTSYTVTNTMGSQKFSLKLEMDFVNLDQNLMGFNTLNLNNGWRDPTFTREVEYNNYLAQFIPNARANNVIVRIKGPNDADFVNWGVYNNVQQTNKSLLRQYFSSADGVRVLCANQPNGPGLTYNSNPSSYSIYQFQDTGGQTLTDATNQFIEFTRKLTQDPLSNPTIDVPNMDRNLAIDPSIWTVALENLLTDDDSYINKGCDFMTYRDPVDSRTHVLQRDANETWTQNTWSITRNFTQTNKPVLSRVLAVPELRQRYMAHYRTVKANLSWANYFQSRFEARRNLIAAAVAADNKKLYTTQNFTDGFGTSSVTLINRITGTSFSGPTLLAGGTIPGIQQFVEGRAAFLNDVAQNAELAAVGPTISAVNITNPAPALTAQVFVTAAVAAAGSPVSKVEMFFRRTRSDIYERISMLDNGLSGDGAAGDGVYGVQVPITPTPGQTVAYYVMATSSNSFNSLSFLPTAAERGPRFISYGLGANQPIQLTEYLYSGNQGEFMEFTNRSNAAIDLTGWVVKDDQLALPGFSLTSLGVLQPGESFVVTEAIAADFRAAWNLPTTTKVLGQLGAVGVGGSNLGRSDQIHIYDQNGILIDRLFFGDQTFPGSIRAQNFSGQAPCAALGQNVIASWVLSAVGDSYGSVQSNANASNLRDVGSPGSTPTCSSANTTIFANGFE